MILNFLLIALLQTSIQLYDSFDDKIIYIKADKVKIIYINKKEY